VRPVLKQNEKKIDSLIDEASSAVKQKASEAITKKAPELMANAISFAASNSK
jgi:hypothetical protein